MRHAALCLTAFALVSHATPTAAQAARPDTGGFAIVQVRNQCPLTLTDATTSDYAGPQGESALGAAAATFAAGLVGDAVTAGLAGLGAALEQASQERSFSATGQTSFDFYWFERESNTVAWPATMAPTMAATGGQCLVIAVPNTGTGEDLAVSDPSVGLANLGDVNPDAASQWAGMGLPARPALYIEAELQRRPDGFRVRPVLVWYNSPLRGAPTRAARSEMHVTFATPAVATDASALGTPFAIARIPLPELRPGGPAWTARSLRPYAGAVMPLRPAAGSAETAAGSATALAAAIEANKLDVVLLRRAVAAAQVAAAQRGAGPDKQAALVALQAQLADAEAATTRLEGRRAAFRTRALTEMYGSTNVQARFAVIRDANAFGLAMAKALQARSAALGTAVGAALVPETPQQAFTADDSAYVAALGTVDIKQAEYELAVAEGDPLKVIQARSALRNAKAAANAAAAAAASGRSIPFPDLI